MPRDAAPERCETIFRRLVDGRGDASVDANDLLACFFRGYPLDNLRELLRSDDAEVAKSGAWIASELAARAAPLLDEIVSVLDNPIPYARFFAIDAILTCAGENRGDAIARVVRLADDADPGVRWKVFQFLTRASDAQLAAAEPLLDDSFHAGVDCLLGRGDIATAIASGAPVIRRFALAAALRRGDRALLEMAAGSADSELRDWATEALAT